MYDCAAAEIRPVPRVRSSVSPRLLPLQAYAWWPIRGRLFFLKRKLCAADMQPKDIFVLQKKRGLVAVVASATCL